MPYGLSQKSRLKVLQGYQNYNRFSVLEDEEVVYGIEAVMGPEILEDFHEHQYQAHEAKDDMARAMIFFEQVHNRAIFDSFNE